MRYGAAYVRAWCKRHNRGRKWGQVIEHAAADALAALYWGRSTINEHDVDHHRRGVRVTVRERCVALGISSRDYVKLCSVARAAYGLRLAEAEKMFERQMKTAAPASAYHGIEGKVDSPPACPLPSAAAKPRDFLPAKPPRLIPRTKTGLPVVIDSERSVFLTSSAQSKD